jgi:C_GCAxxG_C_C family probable redox protein
MTHLFFSKSHNRYHLSTYSQNLSFIYNKSIIFAAEIKITNKKIKKKKRKMTMETRKEIAAEKKRCGSHNCTQAVLCTYHDFTGMDEETIKNAGNAFAAGMGNMEGTCGALVGAGIVLGLATQDKAKSIKGMRMIMDKFKQRNGATQCKLLKGVGTGKVLRECPLCVADASEFLEEILEKEGIQK